MYQSCPPTLFLLFYLSSLPSSLSVHSSLTILKSFFPMCERTHVKIVFLDHVAEHDILRFYSFSCNWHEFIFLYGWIIFHSESMGFSYWFNCWWASRLIPYLDCYQLCLNTYEHASIFMYADFIYFVCILRSGISGLNIKFRFLGNYHSIFQGGYTILHCY